MAKIKTFVTKTPEEMDDLANTFEKTHNVIASQTEMLLAGNNIFYRITMFYKE